MVVTQPNFIFNKVSKANSSRVLNVDNEFTFDSSFGNSGLRVINFSMLAVYKNL